MEIDFIIPCYNPAPDWEDNLISQFKELNKLLPADRYHIIVVDDGSHKPLTLSGGYPCTDFISMICIRNSENRGKGYSLRKGVKESKNNIIIYTDSDFPYTPSSVSKIIKSLRKTDTDLAIGKRDKQYYEQIPTIRKFVSKLLRQLNKVILSSKHTDTQVGLKGFKGNVKNLFLKTNTDRFLIDLEFIKKASKHQLNIEAIPVTLRSNIQLSEIKATTLLKELGSFLKILFSQ